jgi:hypothetical protein
MLCFLVIENNIFMRFVQSKDIVHETHGTMVEINLASKENTMKLMHVYISSFAKKEALLPNKKKGRVKQQEEDASVATLVTEWSTEEERWYGR